MKFVKDPNQIYTIMDFEEGEEIEFAYLPDKPSSVAAGHAFYRSKVDGRIRLMSKDEVERCIKTEKGDAE